MDSAKQLLDSHPVVTNSGTLSCSKSPSKRFEVRHCHLQKSLKGEDVVFLEVSQGSENSHRWRLFAVLDGHQGVDCAEFVRKHLWVELEPRLPQEVPSSWEGDEAAKFGAKVRESILQAFDLVDESWYKEKKPSGTTATIALIIDKFLTVANVGDSSAFLYDSESFIEMTKDHRVGECKPEQTRLLQEHVYIAPLAMSLKEPAKPGEQGFGPLRVWPGGLAVSRSIGDGDVTPQVVCFPHIKQIVIPESGARLVIASDGLWDALPKKRILSMVENSKLTSCPPKLINTACRAQNGVVTDDTSVLVIDIVPQDTPDFKAHSRTLKKSSKKGGFGCFGCVSGSAVKEDGNTGLYYDCDSLYMDSATVRQRSIRNFGNALQSVVWPHRSDYTVHGGSHVEVYTGKWEE